MERRRRQKAILGGVLAAGLGVGGAEFALSHNTPPKELQRKSPKIEASVAKRPRGERTSLLHSRYADRHDRLLDTEARENADDKKIDEEKILKSVEKFFGKTATWCEGEYFTDCIKEAGTEKGALVIEKSEGSLSLRTIIDVNDDYSVVVSDTAVVFTPTEDGWNISGYPNLEMHAQDQASLDLGLSFLSEVQTQTHRMFGTQPEDRPRIAQEISEYFGHAIQDSRWQPLMDSVPGLRDYMKGEQKNYEAESKGIVDM